MNGRGGPDAVIIGAGFYGLHLATRLAGAGRRVLVVEMAGAPMTRASAINQARVHTGFHYPRSFVTAARSLHNFPRFIRDFAPAIVDDFQMLYAVARSGSKVSARRFFDMFTAMGAPIERAGPMARALFDGRMVEDVFACREYAFDHTNLCRILLERIAALPVAVRFGTAVERVEARPGPAVACHLSDGTVVEAPRVFNVTYARLNAVLTASGLAPLPVKHEMTEIALVEPPPALSGHGITLMDGPFFSCMPFPARGLHSLTHVRYTPHYGWTDEPGGADAYRTLDGLPRQTRWRHMAADAARFVPDLREVVWRQSLFDVKTVPVRNEADDGRPILFAGHAGVPGLHSVLGSKIDTIYDLSSAALADGPPAAAPCLAGERT